MLEQIVFGGFNMECIGYIIGSTEYTVTVVLPEKPFGKLKCKLPQREKKVDAECYDKYELKGFEIDVDQDGDVVGWKFTNVEKLVDVKYFVALLADRRVIADDCKAYKIWDNKELHSDDWVSQFDWAFSNGEFSSVNNIRLFIRNGTVYGSDTHTGYRFRNSWDIEDILAEYLDSYDRYSVSNFGTMPEEKLNPLLAAENSGVDILMRAAKMQ